MEKLHPLGLQFVVETQEDKNRKEKQEKKLRRADPMRKKRAKLCSKTAPLYSVLVSYLLHKKINNPSKRVTAFLNRPKENTLPEKQVPSSIGSGPSPCEYSGKVSTCY